VNQGRKYEEINLGDRAEYKRTVTQNDVLLFAGFSGDHNPIHLDEDYAWGTMFGQRIAHGMLSACFLS
jgi:3-hydroxybutyryl-CoA dehydratase